MRKLFFAAGIAFVLGLPGGASAIDLDQGSSVCFVHTISGGTACWTRRHGQGPTVIQVERVGGEDYWVRHFNLDGSASAHFGSWARVRALLGLYL